MKIPLYLILFFSFIDLYSQTSEYSYNIFLFPQGYNLELLNSKGSSALFNNVANLNGLNPSAISQFDNLSLGLTYQFQSKIPDAWVFGFELNRAYVYIPQSLGFIYKSDHFSLGFGFDQKYNGKPEMDPIPVTTMNQPEGTGEYISLEYRQMLQRYSLSGAYTINGIFTDKSGLAVGIRFNLNRFSDYESLASVSAEGIFWKESFEAGINYFYDFSVDKRLSLGFSYGNKVEMSGDLKYITDSAPIQYTDTARGPVYYTFLTPTARVNFPAELKFDLIYRHSYAITIAGNLTYINWGEINSNVNNQPEFSMSFIFSPNNSFTASAGFYYTDYTYKIDIASVTDQMNAFYFTAGTSFNIGLINIDLALADSHLFSGTNRKQTIGKIGIGYSF